MFLSQWRSQKLVMRGRLCAGLKGVRDVISRKRYRILAFCCIRSVSNSLIEMCLGYHTGNVLYMFLGVFNHFYIFSFRIRGSGCYPRICLESLMRFIVTYWLFPNFFSERGSGVSAPEKLYRILYAFWCILSLITPKMFECEMYVNRLTIIWLRHCCGAVGRWVSVLKGLGRTVWDKLRTVQRYT